MLHKQKALEEIEDIFDEGKDGVIKGKAFVTEATRYLWRCLTLPSQPLTSSRSVGH